MQKHKFYEPKKGFRYQVLVKVGWHYDHVEYATDYAHKKDIVKYWETRNAKTKAMRMPEECWKNVALTHDELIDFTDHIRKNKYEFRGIIDYGAAAHQLGFTYNTEIEMWERL